MDLINKSTANTLTKFKAQMFQWNDDMKLNINSTLYNESKTDYQSQEVDFTNEITMNTVAKLKLKCLFCSMWKQN